MDANKLKEILDKHLKWLQCEEGGSWANLYGADLSWANLYGANLMDGLVAWMPLPKPYEPPKEGK